MFNFEVCRPDFLSSSPPASEPQAGEEVAPLSFFCRSGSYYSQSAFQGIGDERKSGVAWDQHPSWELKSPLPTAQAALPPLCWHLGHITTCHLASAPTTSRAPFPTPTPRTAQE